MGLLGTEDIGVHIVHILPVRGLSYVYVILSIST